MKLYEIKLGLMVIETYGYGNTRIQMREADKTQEMVQFTGHWLRGLHWLQGHPARTAVRASVLELQQFQMARLRLILQYITLVIQNECVS